jgi:hypothetical protein
MDFIGSMFLKYLANRSGSFFLGAITEAFSLRYTRYGPKASEIKTTNWE